MTTKNPEIPPTLPPEIQQLFDRQNAGYSATADEIVKKVADAKAAAQSDDTKLLAGAPGGAAGQTIENDPTQAPTERPRRQRVRSVTPVPTSAPTQEPTPVPTLAPNPDAAPRRRPQTRTKESTHPATTNPLATDTAEKGERAEEKRLGEYDRAEVIKAFQLADARQRLIQLQAENKKLRQIVTEVDALGGFEALKQAVAGLSGKGLIFKSVREAHERLFRRAWEDGKLELQRDNPEDLFAQYHDVLVQAETVLLKLRDEIIAVERDFPAKLEAVRGLISAWKDIRQRLAPGQRLEFDGKVKKHAGEETIPRMTTLEANLAADERQHHWEGEESRGAKREIVTVLLPRLQKLVAAAQAVAVEMGVTPPVVAARDKTPASAASPVAAPAAAPAVPADTSDVTVPIKSAKPASREPSGPASGDVAVAKRLGFLENLRSRFRDRYNAASLRLDEVERSAKDDRQYRALRETLASIQADFQLISDPVTLQRYAAGEMEVANGSTKVSDGYLDIVDQLKSLTERVELVGRTLGETAAEKDSRAAEEAEFREQLDRAKDLVAMGITIRQYVGTKWDKKALPELRKRASGTHEYPNVFEVEKWLEKSEKAHHWRGEESVQDKRRLVRDTLPMLEEMVGHMRDIATEMRDAGEISPTKDDKALSLDMVREERLARERFEQKLVQTVVAFATNLDGKLRQQGKDTTYRMSALLSHLPTVVDALIEKLKGNLVLSPAEKKAMLKQCNAAVIDSVSE